LSQSRRKYSNELVDKIKNMIDKNMSTGHIVKTSNISKSNFYRIKNNELRYLNTGVL